MTDLSVNKSIAEDSGGMLSAALECARLHFAVFPLHHPSLDGACSCGNADCGKTTGKHPRTKSGFKNATTSDAGIRTFWTRWPNANIGIATGAVSGVMVIDVDGPEGEESLRRMTEQHGPLPATRTAKTGRGRHLYFKHPGGRVKSKAPICAAFPHVDSRGDGGYVVAPPSLHYSGQRYAWDALSPEQIADAPEWLIRLIDQGHSSVRSAANEAINDPSVVEGSRNTSLTRVAGSMRRAGATELEIAEALNTYNARWCKPPLDVGEVQRIARSVASYAPGTSDDVRRTLTDIGNAKRFVDRYAEDVRYVPERGQWLRWQGSHWQVDETGAVMEMAKVVAAAIYEEGTAVTDASLRSEIARHSKCSAGAARLKAMVDLAKSDPKLLVRASELDSHRGLLGVLNGVVDLASGKLRAARREDYITRLAPVHFDPDAPCPAFDQFLNDVMGGDQKLVGFLQRTVGYALSGYTEAHCLFFLYGTGANGKSTFTGMIRDLLGDEYCRGLATEAITARPGRAGATPELARLPGARVVLTSEVEDGSWLAESLVKDMTGGDKLVARNLYQDPFEFVPQFKLFITGNHKPVIRGSDEGIWRRIHLVPFTITIPPARRDSGLPARIRTELSGVLNWAIAGYRAWRRQGLTPPPAVTDAVDEYRREMDVLGLWLEQRCVLDEQAEVRASAAYLSYREWAGANGFKPWTSAAFGRAVRQRFAAPRKADGIIYRGIGLIDAGLSRWP